MDEAIRTITEGLKRAIQFEGDGHNFYRMAANGTFDEKGKEVFEMLAREEAEHARFLRTQYDSFLKSGKADSESKLPAHGRLTGEHPIFSEKVKQNILDAHMEMSALAIGIQLELNSIKFYQEQANLGNDPEVSKFFTELAEWEQEHYDALLRQQEALKEDYWSKGGFIPF